MTSLLFGSVELHSPTGSTRVMAQGTSRGQVIPIEVAVTSWLQDGTIVMTRGHDNREVTIRVRLFGNDLTALSALEASLVAELEKPNTLTWTPKTGPASVFVVVTSSLDYEDGYIDGAEEQEKPWRTYNLRLVCEAFVRSTAPFTAVGTVPGGSTTTTLDTCGATIGWSATVDGGPGTVTTAAGPPTTIAVTASLVSEAGHVLTLTKTFAATTSTTNLLMVDWLGFANVTLSANGDGVALTKVAEFASPTSGYTRTWFRVAASSLAVTTFTALIKGSGSKSLRIDNVAVTDVAPISGTNRQQIRSLTVPGSARTPASLAIESATAALGDTLIYVYPNDSTTTGYLPTMRPFRATGNTVTANSALVSGSSEPLTGSSVNFLVPIGLFPPGLYLLVGRLATSGGGTPTITYTGRTGIGVGLGLGGVTGTRTITTTTGYQNFVLGRMQLPTIDLGPDAATAGVTMSLTVSASTTCTYDEFWLFNQSIGQLIAVDCGSGTAAVGGPSRRLFIEPPTITTPRPTLRVGHNADRSDSHFPIGAVTSWDFPQFQGGGQANVLAVTPNATDATVSLSGYARWHSHAAA